MHIQRTVVNPLVDELEASFADFINELNNQREVKTNYWAANIMDINKDKVVAEAAKLIALINQAKKLKPFNPKSKENL